jgi:hypothetical protein
MGATIIKPLYRAFTKKALKLTFDAHRHGMSGFAHLAKALLSPSIKNQSFKALRVIRQVYPLRRIHGFPCNTL